VRELSLDDVALDKVTDQKAIVKHVIVLYNCDTRPPAEQQQFLYYAIVG
jgi:hypothetical protein